MRWSHSGASTQSPRCCRMPRCCSTASFARRRCSRHRSRARNPRSPTCCSSRSTSSPACRWTTRTRSAAMSRLWRKGWRCCAAACRYAAGCSARCTRCCSTIRVGVARRPAKSAARRCGSAALGRATPLSCRRRRTRCRRASPRSSASSTTSRKPLRRCSRRRLRTCSSRPSTPFSTATAASGGC
ncbi:MAG: hypothetical protein AW10_02507 [Candidatus Accumulibacter appositus]|uniref:Uncharacterized protein n=1 Tax=Candidatus Accumulibacter appositus TaxID=1454003 RepID=A0A011N9E0_9PROT|nr:MAG: hypothetical protein AW10_02507 [Candidatus Accumulibacter appositus]